VTPRLRPCHGTSPPRSLRSCYPSGHVLGDDVRPVDFPCQNLGLCTHGHHEQLDAGYLREEPVAGKPHARICEGKAEWPSYSTIPRHIGLCMKDASARLPLAASHACEMREVPSNGQPSMRKRYPPRQRLRALRIAFVETSGSKRSGSNFRPAQRRIALCSSCEGSFQASRNSA